MTSRRRKQLLLGVGAFLGLVAAGCQTGPIATASFRTNGLLDVVASSHEERPPAELLRPRPLLSRSISSPIPVAAASPSGVSLDPPVVRASAQAEEADDPLLAGAMVASSWRTLHRDPDPEPVASPDLTPPPPTDLGDPTRTLSASAEALPAPRKSNNPVQAEVIHHDPQPVGGHAALPHHAVPVGHHGPGYPGLAVPREGQKAPLPPYMIEPPDILLVQLLRDPKRVPMPIDGEFLVRPDGTITLGVYGTVGVAGLTLDQAREAIAARLALKLKPQKELDEEGKETGRTIPISDEVVVDVVEFASKYCYLIADGAGFGEQVVRIPINGSDTVLDVVGKIGGLPSQSSKKKVWVARAHAAHLGHHQLLPVDWVAIAQRGQTDTNYQVYPGDRIYVNSDARLRADTQIAKTLNPIERILGTTLLGSSVVNSIRNGGRRFSNNQ